MRNGATGRGSAVRANVVHAWVTVA